MKKKTKIFIILAILFISFLTYLFSVTRMPEPQHKQIDDSKMPVLIVSDSIRKCDNSWLKINEFGLWELYVEGDPYTMGYSNGVLTKHLVHYQEEAFVAQLDQIIPSRWYLHFLRVFLGWFNRDLLNYIPLEYQLEVAGVSKSASDEFNFIAPAFQRIMSYHGAHDMGHALQSMCLVGCTSFGVLNNYSQDSSMLIGRNFDFYAGDKFSENKIIAFMRPDKGYPFMSVTWGGMIGVVSGMNIKGLTITLNSEPTGIPSISKTPVSILARKILQYAANIDQAYAIAQEYETFVSESFLIASGEENKLALIEKTPDKISIIYSTNNKLIATNHFQDSSHISTKFDVLAFQSASHYRFARVEALIDSIKVFTPKDVAYLLRDTKGEKGKNIGLGNEKAINQLIAHHGIIFKPKEKKVWVSAAPFQLGTFVAYDLDSIFANPNSFLDKKTYNISECIKADALINTNRYENFIEYKRISKIIEQGIADNKTFTRDYLDNFISLNNKFYLSWFIVGKYFVNKKDYHSALVYFKKALNCEIPQKNEFDEINSLITECEEN